MKRRITAFFVGLLIVSAAFGLVACGEYVGNPDVSPIRKNEVLHVERSRLRFARGMDVDAADLIARCGCAFVEDGVSVEVTADMLRDGTVSFEPFELDTVGSNKQIELTYGNARNYIFYDVDAYYVDFYLDAAQTEFWKRVPASATHTENLDLSVWVDLTQCNYSTDKLARALDGDRAARFDGWFDAADNKATGLYGLAAPIGGNERAVALHADFLTPEEAERFDIVYDGEKRVFRGYIGEASSVHIPEGVTDVDFSRVFAKTPVAFRSLRIPSTARLDVPFVSGVNTDGLEEIVVDRGNLRYASYSGALYSRDFSTLYLMPALQSSGELHSGVETVASWACAYWRRSSFAIPASVTTLQHYCFAFSALENVSGIENVTTIKSGVFYRSRVRQFDDAYAHYIAYTPESGSSDRQQFILSMVLDRSVETYTVWEGTVQIAGDAFKGCTALRSIDLGDVTRIGGSAFSGCTSLTEVKFSDALTQLGSGVFYGCRSLTSFALPDVTYIADNGVEYEHTVPNELFYNCVSLTSVTLPDNLLQIGTSAFRGCGKLTDVRLPDSVYNIAGSAFRSCSSLTAIELPANLRLIGSYAFYAAGLTRIDLEACPALKSLSLGCFYGTRLTEVTIPDRIKAVPQQCFAAVRTLRSVHLGAVEELGYQSFTACSALTEIDWGSALRVIGERAFSGCTGLSRVVVPDTVTVVEQYAFQSCRGLVSFTLGKNVATFGQYGFASDGVTFDSRVPALFGCDNLQSFSVAEGNSYFAAADGVLYGSRVGGADYGAFGVLYAVPSRYGGDKTFVCPDTVEIVLPYSFYNQKTIEKIVVNDGAVNIGTGAFYGAAVREVHISRTVTGIGAGIVSGCTALERFTVDAANPVYSTDGNLLYRGSAIELYIGLYDGGKVEIEDGMTEIVTGVFNNNTKITSVTIPDSVTRIGEKAFAKCANLTEIKIGKGLQTLDPTAFAELKNLRTITVDPDNPYFKTVDNVLYTRDGSTLLLCAARNGMTSLDNLDGAVTAIGDYAFAWHGTLRSVELPAGVVTVGAYAFYECRAVESIVGSAALERIGERAFSFENVTSDDVDARTHLSDTLRTVFLYDNVAAIDDYAFYGQYGITDVYFMMRSKTQVDVLLAGCGSNIGYLTDGCLTIATGKYANNDGNGIRRHLYSDVQPMIEYNEYGWFYLDENGKPQNWTKTER